MATNVTTKHSRLVGWCRTMTHFIYVEFWNFQKGFTRWKLLQLVIVLSKCLYFSSVGGTESIARGFNVVCTRRWNGSSHPVGFVVRGGLLFGKRQPHFGRRASRRDAFRKFFNAHAVRTYFWPLRVQTTRKLKNTAMSNQQFYVSTTENQFCARKIKSKSKFLKSSQNVSHKVKEKKTIRIY